MYTMLFTCCPHLMEKEIDRLDKYLTHKGITDYSFGKTTRMKGWIGGARRRKSSFQDETRDKILLAYPDLNRIWLMTGNGEMFNGEAPPPKEVPAKEGFSLIQFLHEKIAHQEEVISLKDQTIEDLRKNLEELRNKNKEI